MSRSMTRASMCRPPKSRFGVGWPVYTEPSRKEIHEVLASRGFCQQRLRAWRPRFASWSQPAVASAPSSTVQLRNSSSRAAAKSPLVGSVAANSQIGFEVDLTLPDQAGAAAFAKAVSTRGNALYGKYLTPAQWEARFSPSAATVAKVSQFLRQSGFSVGQVPADRMAIPASGTAAQVEQRVRHRAGARTACTAVTLRLASRDLSVPADIAGVVSGVGRRQTSRSPSPTTPPVPPAARRPRARRRTASRSRSPRASGSRRRAASYYGDQVDTTLPHYGNGYPSNRAVGGVRLHAGPVPQRLQT